MKTLLLKILFAYSLLCCFSCEKKEIAPDEPAKVQEDLAPETFDLTVKEVTDNYAVLKWTEALDPEYEDITYSVQLDGKEVGSNLKTQTFKIEKLIPEKSYKGNVVATDPTGHATSQSFEFTTKDGFVKFSNNYEFGNSSGTSGSWIEKTKDGGYVSVGSVAFSSLNILVVKMDASGNVQWQKTVDGLPGGSLKIVQLPDERYIIITSNHLYKLDARGNLLWDKLQVFAGSGGQYNALILTKDKQLLLGGESTIKEVLPETPDTKYYYGCIIKMDLDGNIIWQKTYGNKKRNDVTDFTEDPNGNFVVLGGTELKPDITSPWVFKIDPNGKVLWDKSFGDKHFYFASSVKLASNGNIFCVGSSVGDYNVSSMRILKLDASGNKLLNIFASVGSNDYANDMDITTDGSLIITGETGTYNTELTLVRFDQSLNMVWSKTHNGGEAYNTGNRVMQTADGGYIVAGSRFTPIIGEQSKMWVIKTNPKGEFQ